MATPNSKEAMIMEVVKKTAYAYFARSPAEVKEMAHDVFDKIDEDGNGRISIAEFLHFLLDEQEDEDDNEVQEELEMLFKRIDTNGDGTLDFHEFLTFFYINMSDGIVFCDGCQNILVNIYFSCLDCHLETDNSYDLCADCYRRNNFSHAHSQFLDNLALLKFYKSNCQSQDNNSQVGQPNPYIGQNVEMALAIRPCSPKLLQQRPSRKAAYFKTAVRVVKIGTLATKIAIAGGICTIM